MFKERPRHCPLLGNVPIERLYLTDTCWGVLVQILYLGSMTPCSGTRTNLAGVLLTGVSGFSIYQRFLGLKVWAVGTRAELN